MGGLDSWCELVRIQKLEIFYQVVVILGLDSLLELGELLVNLLDHLAGDLIFMLLVEVRDVLSENIFKTNELLHFRVLPLKVHEGAESLVSS
jgi:hypothetical protein